VLLVSLLLAEHVEAHAELREWAHATDDVAEVFVGRRRLKDPCGGGVLALVDLDLSLLDASLDLVELLLHEFFSGLHELVVLARLHEDHIELLGAELLEDNGGLHAVVFVAEDRRVELAVVEVLQLLADAHAVIQVLQLLLVVLEAALAVRHVLEH